MRAIFFWIAMLWATVCHAADLAFDQPRQEIRLKPDAEKVEVEFKFENKTDHPVTIKSIEKSCATCLQATVDGGKMTYQPGEKGIIRVSFAVGNFSGTVEKMTVVWLEGTPPGTGGIELKAILQIPELVTMDAKTVVWFLGDKPEARKVVLKVTHDQPIRITGVTTSSDAFKAELLTIKDGSGYELVLTPAQTTRPSIGIIRLQTDCPIKRHQQLQVFGVVRAKVPAGAAGR